MFAGLFSLCSRGVQKFFPVCVLHSLVLLVSDPPSCCCLRQAMEKKEKIQLMTLGLTDLLNIELSTDNLKMFNKAWDEML